MQGRTWGLLAIWACLFLGGGCQSSSSSSQNANKISINIGKEPQSLDPGKGRDLQSQTLLRMLFEGLTRVNGQNQAEPALAEKIDISPDGKTYTFTLRSAVWSNGMALTAHDFAYAWKRMLAPTFASNCASQLYVIRGAKEAKEGKISLDETGIHALDDKTLLVQLSHTAPYFLELIASPPFFPICSAIDCQLPEWAYHLPSYVSCGPFLLKEWSPNDQIRVEKNPTYWDAAHVHLDEICLVMVDEHTEYIMFEKKELDWAGSPLSVLSLDALDALHQDARLKSRPFIGSLFLRTQTAKPPFDSVWLRRAFALAIDRPSIANYVAQGGLLPATQLTPVAMGVQSGFFPDPSLAKRCLEEGLQVPQEEGLRTSLRSMQGPPLSPIKLTYSSSERRNHRIAQALQQQWAKNLGIEVALEPLDRKILYARLASGDFQLAMGSWVGDFNDPINFLEVFKYRAGSANNTNWENASFAQLLDSAAHAETLTLHMRHLKQAEQLLLEELPIIPLFQLNMLYLQNEELDGVVLSPLGVLDFKWSNKQLKIKQGAL